MLCRAGCAIIFSLLVQCEVLSQAGELLGSPPGKGVPITASLPNGISPLETAVSSSRFAKLYGETLPPVGYVKFCASGQAECKSQGPGQGHIVVNDQIWSQLIRTNRDVNNTISAISDLELYGEEEHWAYPKVEGDCEDFVLLKKLRLTQMGFPRNALLITVVRDEKGRGHAVLTVNTTSGDYILDNRRSDILMWTETGYRYLERQSKSDPMLWIALQKQSELPKSIVYVPNSEFGSGVTQH